MPRKWPQNPYDLLLFMRTFLALCRKRIILALSELGNEPSGAADVHKVSADSVTVPAASGQQLGFWHLYISFAYTALHNQFDLFFDCVRSHDLNTFKIWFVEVAPTLQIIAWTFLYTCVTTHVETKKVVFLNHSKIFQNAGIAATFLKECKKI